MVRRASCLVSTGAGAARGRRSEHRRGAQSTSGTCPAWKTTVAGHETVRITGQPAGLQGCDHAGCTRRSAGSPVLVDEAAEDIDAFDRPAADRGSGPERGLQLQTPMRSSRVVVHQVDRQDPVEMACGADPDPVQALRPDGAHPTLGVGIRARCPRRDLQDLDARRREHGVERRVNVASRSRTRNRNPRAASSRSINRFRAAWVTHCPVGCAVIPPRSTRRRSTSMTNRTYSRVGPTVSTVKKSQR
jgi:hypothetical protein